MSEETQPTGDPEEPVADEGEPAAETNEHEEPAAETPDSNEPTAEGPESETPSAEADEPEEGEKSGELQPVGPVTASALARRAAKASEEVAVPATAQTTITPSPPSTLGTTKKYTTRLMLIYALLAAVLIGAVAGIVFYTVNPSSGSSSSSGWSTWKPKNASTASMTKAIADHVAKEYKLNKKGSQLLGVVSQPLTVQIGTHKVSISHIAVRKNAQTDKGIQIIPSADTWDYELCGLGTACSIASGKPSETRGRLVRREALEAALYTFKFIPTINSVVAFMPPPAGQTQSTLLYLRRSELEKQLAQPLRKTLPLETPPLPSESDLQEAATIDKLTNHTVYNYKLQQLQDASVLLVLDPFQS